MLGDGSSAEKEVVSSIHTKVLSELPPQPLSIMHFKMHAAAVRFSAAGANGQRPCAWLHFPERVDSRECRDQLAGEGR